MGRMRNFIGLAAGAGWILLLGGVLGCAVPQPETGAVYGKPGVLYQPGPKLGMTFESVKADLNDLLTGSLYHREVWLRRPQDDSRYEPARFVIFDTTIVHPDRIEFTAVSEAPFVVLYEDLVDKEIFVKKETAYTQKEYTIAVPGLAGSFHAKSLAGASKFADDLYFLQHEEGKKSAGQDALTPEFEALASRYRALAVKPQVTEEQRRYIVQANALGEQKDYAGALEIYGKAIRVDPVAYPQAYFNMALLAGQKGRYRHSIALMKKYLLLVPDAKDARAAQDKIYEWEILMQKR
jgi:tetratricopeptide (TPR) repeat protein